MRKLCALLLALQLLCAPAFGAWQGNGSSQDVSVADNAVLTFTDGVSFTLSGWAYVISNAGAASNVMIAWNSLSAASSFGVYCREASNGTAPNAVQFNIEDDDNEALAFASSTTPCSTTDTWFHWALTMSANATTGYINAVNVGTSSDAGFDNVDAAVAMTILSANGGSFFNGRVAEMARWDRVLTAAELTTLTKYAPNCIPGRIWYVPAIREYMEVVAKLTVTNNGSTVAAHPPLIRCH